MLAADTATPCTGRSARQSGLLSVLLNFRLLQISIVLAGFGLRLGLLDGFALHPDEAIYAYWALHGLRIDPLFLQVWPDKPPLFLWLLGGFFKLFDASAAAARIPNILFSTLSIVLVGALAQRWWGRRSALIAAAAMALNPFAISFAPTVFTDPLMVMAWLLALCTAAQGRSLWVGFWCGIAIMTKQQGVLLTPAALLLLWETKRRDDCVGLSRQASFRCTAAETLRWLVGLLSVVAPILYWDSLRWAVAPSPWDLGARNAAGFGLAAPETWLPRLLAWAELLRYLFGSGSAWVVGASILSFSALALFQHRAALRWLPAALLTIWSVGFLALHLVSTVQVWDRYLLPLAPIVALLTGFGAGGLLERWEVYAKVQALRRGAEMRQGWQARAALLLVTVWLLAGVAPALQAAQGRLPIGGDRGGYTGVEQVAAWLEAQAQNARPVVYHRSLGWHMQFLLFAPLREGRIELRWVPSATQLADNAAKTPHRPLYWVEAEWLPERSLTMHLATRKLALRERLRVGRFTVYEIRRREAGDAAWRLCRMARPLGWTTIFSSEASVERNR
ncbi:MAG: glycosyltransferase family 39 protein [Caldilinea sp.]|nr:glycosyltransferase family 39 protein [Caldilinea sp.]MDW8439711.1 glycosyltransferase family 39 protein [Caldilineaceae bacterium]